MDKLEQLVEAYLEQIGNVSKFNKVIIGELIKFYTGNDAMVRVLIGINNVNDDLINEASRKSIGSSPKETATVLLRIKEINKGLLDAVNAILTIEHTEVIVPIFNKMTNNGNNINAYCNDLLRTYLVNLPDDKKEECLKGFKVKELTAISDTINEVVEANPEDQEAKKLFNELVTKIAVESLAETQEPEQKPNVL